MVIIYILCYTKKAGLSGLFVFDKVRFTGQYKVVNQVCTFSLATFKSILSAKISLVG